MPFLRYLLSLGGTEWAAIFGNTTSGKLRVSGREALWQLGRAMGWEDAPLQPCSLSVAVLGRHWCSVLTMICSLLHPEESKGSRVGDSLARQLQCSHGPGAGHDAKMWCLPIPQLAGASQPHQPCFQKPPSTAPREGQQLWNITVPRRRGEALNTSVVLSPFRLQNWILSI